MARLFDARHALLRMLLSTALGLALGMVVLGVVWQHGRQLSVPKAPLRYAAVPDFELIDQAGRPVTREMLKGRVWVADFIFTRCAGQCPLMTAAMARLALRVPDAAGLRLVSITVDPTWDTPSVLAQYAKAHGASADRWLWLTGSRETIERLCVDGFKLAINAESGTPQEPITHSTRMVLVDREGAIRGYYEADDEQAMKRLAHDLRRLLGRAG